jgi:hypothetical protein
MQLSSRQNTRNDQKMGLLLFPNNLFMFNTLYEFALLLNGSKTLGIRQTDIWTE